MEFFLVKSCGSHTAIHFFAIGYLFVNRFNVLFQNDMYSRGA